MKESESNSEIYNFKKSENKKFIIFSLTIIFSIGIIIRIFYFPRDIPIVLDGLTYFWYAIDMSIINTFPLGYSFPNNGWPTFLSIFFNFVDSENFLDYMMVQRTVSTVISTLTVIPAYLLCTRFFNKKLALVGSLMFIVDPKIILNSTLGITEPAFIFLGILTLYLFLSDNKKLVYLSFATVALFTLVRYEGLLLFIPLSIMFFIKFKKEKMVIPNYLIVIGIFLIIILPMAYVKTVTIGDEAIFSHVIAGPQYLEKLAIQDSINNDDNVSNFLINASVNTGKYLIWITIPIFIIFIPYGIVKFFQKRDLKKWTLILSSCFLVLPGLYAFGREIQDPRYLFILLPIFSIISLYSVEKILQKTNKQNIILIIICIFIISSSIVFIEFKKPDYQHQQEAFQISIQIGKIIDGSNSYYPESAYLIPAKISEINFPSLRDTLPEDNKIISTSNYLSLEEYISKGEELGLTHLVVDNKIESNLYREEFLIKIFDEGEKIQYLEKIFDSKDNGFQYHVKVFEIKYDKFEMKEN